MVPNTILTHELIGITVKTASRTAAPPFSRLHGGQAKRPGILTRNHLRVPGHDESGFDLLAIPTPTGRRAFELLSAPIPLTLK